MNTEQTKKLRQLITDIPKTEIHLHLEGMVSVQTLWSLITRNNLHIEGIENREDLIQKYNFKSLDGFIWFYINVLQNCFQNAEDLELLIDDAQRYLKSNNIVYSEIFFAPSKFLQNGLGFGDIVTVLSKGAKNLLKKHGITIKYIIDVSRGFGPENAMHNLQLTIDHKNEHIIGIGLGGAESQGPAQDYKEVFEKAKANGLKTVAHAGEDVGPESVWAALKILGAERIGHGISSIQDDKLVQYLRETQIPLEVCPTSNVFTRKFVDTIEKHPIRPLFDKGVYITLNTDDPTLFSIDLVTEYMNLHQYLHFTPQEIFTLIKNNVFATSLSDTQKENLWAKATSIIKKAEYSLQ